MSEIQRHCSPCTIPRGIQPTATPLPRVRQRPHVSGGNFKRQGNLIPQTSMPRLVRALRRMPRHKLHLSGLARCTRSVATRRAVLQHGCTALHCVATMLRCVAWPCLADRLVAPDLSLRELRHMVVPERRESAGGAKAKRGTALQRRNTAPPPAGGAPQRRVGTTDYSRRGRRREHSTAEQSRAEQSRAYSRNWCVSS